MSIIISDLVKYYGDHLIVNNCSIEIADGEFFALLGASGSGKSTVLRMIAGLTKPTSGKIELNGRDVTNLPPQKREVGFVFQNYAIFKHMSIADNIEFGLKVRRVAKAERTQRQEELLEIVGLSGMGSRYPHQISGGQRQRVALARALAYKPSVLLLDEPFGALDAGIRSQLRESVREIQSKLNITTILVTHDQEEAFELADRIGIIEKGKLVEIGDSHALYHKPKSSYAATFIGAGSVIVGRVRNEKIKLGNVVLDFPSDAPKHIEGDPVRVLFRPEHVLCSREPLQEQAGLFLLGEGVVGECLFSGANVKTRIKVVNLVGVRPLSAQHKYGEGILITSFQPSFDFQANLKEGEKCYVYIKEFHVLSPSGLRMLIKCAKPERSSAAWQFGTMLAAAARGKATLLHVFDQDLSFETEKNKIQEIFLGELNPNLNLEFKLKQGEEYNEILHGAQEDFFEIYITDRQGHADGHYDGLESLVMDLLEEAKVPVMLMAEKQTKLEKILVCTAGGEPGRYDVILGARLARQTGATVTVLHVKREGASEEVIKRAERHLKDAKNILNDLGVSAETILKKEPAIATILNTAHEGNFDLIVLGAPAPKDHPAVYGKSLTAKIISGTKLPVLVVPMQA